MNIQILISTTAQRLQNVHQVLLPPADGVSYVVSCQGVTGVMADPFQRGDVTFLTMKEMGLSRNRNNCLTHATGDILLLADDDEQLVPATVMAMERHFAEHPAWDIIQYRIGGIGKKYPSDYYSSVELAMRASVAKVLRFDPRFGLGSECLACGEEEVFIHDARRHGFIVGAMPQTICHIEGETTGTRFVDDEGVQRAKGAVLAYTMGQSRAKARCVREAMSRAARANVNPLPLLRNMWWGVKYIGNG